MRPLDRAKRGRKLHLAVEGGGLPLSVLVTVANTNDSLVFARWWTTSPGAHAGGPAPLPPRQGPRRQGL